MAVFESAQGLVVNEINHTLEFRNRIEPTGVDIAGRVVDYALALAAQLKREKGESA